MAKDLYALARQTALDTVEVIEILLNFTQPVYRNGERIGDFIADKDWAIITARLREIQQRIVTATEDTHAEEA